MNLDAFLAIVGMVFVTYLTRAGGLWLIDRVTLTPLMKRWLNHIPGAILISIIAPMVADSNPSEWLAVAPTAIIAFATRNILTTLVVGLFAVLFVRNVL